MHSTLGRRSQDMTAGLCPTFATGTVCVRDDLEVRAAISLLSRLSGNRGTRSGNWSSGK